ncbi:hypothetical protein ACOSP7_008544 [Xanthoceras sorbifolium]
MGRSPCCSKEGLNRGAWTATEDKILTDYINAHGDGKWRRLPKAAGLERCGKSCRLRWLNYLRPDIKRGNLTQDEEDLIVRLHRLLGNRWSLIAGRLPGRTDNEIKNYWNTKLSKNAQAKQSNPTKSDKKSITTPRNIELSPAKVFRTKAIRLIMNHTVQGGQVINTVVQQDHNPENHIHHDSNIVISETRTLSSMDANLKHYKYSPVESESSTGGRGSSSFSFLAKEENSPDYMMSFDVGEISHSGILDLEDMIKGDKNPDESSTQFLPPFCGQSYNLLNEELMLENWNGDGGIEANMDSNFEFSASFLESGEDWMM